MMTGKPTVFIVDDEEQPRASVCALVRSMGLEAQSFGSAEAFLKVDDVERPGCLVTDVRMFGMSGIELLEELAKRRSVLPVIVLTAYAHTPLTVRAMRAGAVTILDKPYHDDELWDAIRTALVKNKLLRQKRERRDEIQRRMASLTESEREVLELVVEGAPNKVIAGRLDVSVRTVENRRREVFNKMQAQSVAELVRLVMEARGEGDA